MPWTAAAPAPSTRRRRRCGGLICPPAGAGAGPSSMGLPPADSSYLPVRARRRGAPETKLMLSRSNPFSFTASSLPAALLRWARRPRGGGRIGVGLVGGGTAGKREGESSRDSRGLKRAVCRCVAA